MADLSSSSCEICLRADDAEAMMTVAIPHSMPAAGRAMVICRDCAKVVILGAVMSEFVSPEEVFPDAPAGADANPDPGPDPASAEAAHTLVLPDFSDGEGAGVDRRESEMPAGSAKSTPPEPEPAKTGGVTEKSGPA